MEAKFRVFFLSFGSFLGQNRELHSFGGDALDSFENVLVDGDVFAEVLAVQAVDFADCEGYDGGYSALVLEDEGHFAEEGAVFEVADLGRKWGLTMMIITD